MPASGAPEDTARATSDIRAAIDADPTLLEAPRADRPVACAPPTGSTEGARRGADMTDHHSRTALDDLIDEREPSQPLLKRRAAGWARRSRAVRLLEKVLALDALSAEELESTLSITAEQLVAFRSGEEPVPLERQLCLALVVLERVPALTRDARGLQAQVRAEISMLSRQTKTHSTAPVSRFGW